MVGWCVPEEEVDRIGAIMADRPAFSHCYHRVNCLDWPYNLYTMVHGRTADDCQTVVDTLCRETGLDDYAMLFSLKELKKISMRYF